MYVAPPGPYTTQSVLAAAYPGGNRSNPKFLLTHTVADDNTALCKRVRPESLVGSYGTAEDDAPPTCPICLARDPRFKAP